MLLAEQRRYGHPFAFALVDIDGLARTNETYGRAAGDRMLIAVAAVLRRQLRAVDRVFRLEEDEFAVVAPHTVADGLATMAERAAKLIDRDAHGRGSADRDRGRDRRVPGRRGQRRAAARGRHRGDLRGEGLGGAGRPARPPSRSGSCKIRSASSESLSEFCRTC